MQSPLYRRVIDAKVAVVATTIDCATSFDNLHGEIWPLVAPAKVDNLVDLSSPRVRSTLRLPFLFAARTTK
jgi:hypothetical protein